MVESEAEALQHGHEDADVLPVGGDGPEHAGQPAETLLQRVNVQGHPAVASLPKKKKNKQQRIFKTRLKRVGLNRVGLKRVGLNPAALLRTASLVMELMGIS